MIAANGGGKRIALIGGAGFIGHHLALSLAHAGHEPMIIDSLHLNHVLAFSSSSPEIKHRDIYLTFLNERLELLRERFIPIQVQDARDYHALCKTLEAMKPEVIILLAGVAHADRSNKDPYSTFDHSLRTLENALDFAKNGGVTHFIYFSSSMVYGNFPNGYVTEETPLEPIGIYGALKFAGEKIVIAYHQVFDLPYTIVRPSALYGERCVSRRVGQIFIENALQGKDVSISGDGTDRLDFTYITDLAEGIKLIIENDRAKNEIFNITYGESRSIADMAAILKAHFPNVVVNYLPKDTLMPNRGTLSVDKARELIGYSPRYPLEVGYEKYINWYKSIWKGPLLM